ncbi:hypothetical protein D3C78_1564390 [compost metagenome]
MRNNAVNKLVTNNTRSNIREPSPKASLKALAAGVTPSLMETMRAFQSLTWRAVAWPPTNPARICRATTSSWAR